MQMTGEYRIPAPRDSVWRALNDPDVLKQCIPGCESIEKISDTELTAKVALAVGPVKARFNGRVTLADLDPPKGYTISGEGQGGVAGFGKGTARVALEEDSPDSTTLRYSAEATVGGKLAQIGARLIDATAKKLADEFFSRFAAVVAPPAEAVLAGEAVPAPVPEAIVTAPPGPEPMRPAAPPARSALRPTVWIPLLIVAIGLLLWLATRW